MKRRSRKRQEEIDAVQELRERFRLIGQCMICGSERTSLEVHEIARGVHRHRAYAERCTWLLLCHSPCHRAVDDYSVWPIALQAAIKMTCDRQFYDLQKLNKLRGRVSDAITQEEVDAAFAAIRLRGVLDWKLGPLRFP